MAGGCAVGVLVGEGTGQLKNLVKHGRIDDATDIALGATVDCIIGAVPGAWAKAAFSKVVTKATSKIRVIVKETIRTLWG